MRRAPVILAAALLYLLCPLCGLAQIPLRYESLARTLHYQSLQNPMDGNGLDIAASGQLKWERLMEDLENARDYILMEYYRFSDDEAGRQIRDIIVRKASEGVRVLLLMENVARPFVRKSFYENMRRAGVELLYFTDTRKLRLWELVPRIIGRDHRKIVVIDGAVAYMGGMNLSKEYRDEWRDMHLRITGPAVESVQEVFNSNWVYAGGVEFPFRLCPDSPVLEKKARFTGKTVQILCGGEEDNPVSDIIVEIIKAADRYLYIQTPYLVPTKPVLNALCDAVGRGVDVRFLVPEKADVWIAAKANKSYYKRLVSSGVRIWEYIPGFNHSKVFVADDFLSFIGSINMDYISLDFNYEDGVVIYDGEVALELKNDFISLLEDSREICNFKD